MTGIFDEKLKNFFGAQEGAYTAITGTEIGKQTFNVKADIRKLLIRKLGRANIPNRTSAKQTIEFNIYEKMNYLNKTEDITCKFSKPDKDEMTIYFSSQSLLSKGDLNYDDVWFIYFKKDDPMPWFGLLSADEWNYIAKISPDNTEPDEDDTEPQGPVAKLHYEVDIDSLTIFEVDPPEPKGETARDNSTHRTISVDSQKTIHENRKIKGTMGEKIAVEIERQKLIKAGREDLLDKIRWIAEKEDGYGYDLISYDIDSEGHEHEIYIEVKTTSGGKNTPFEISIREVKVSEEKGSAFYIYRIYNLKRNSKYISYYKVNGSANEKFDLEPTQFRAYPKSNS